ncbi:MAG: hypothetical protein KIH67_002780 [Candidatus Moranbacteria bacterium]|nr:hypothetical protein [Candidatus Moranbacteria bacterium]
MQSAQESTKRPLYPERPSEGIEDEIQRLAQFESGEAKKLELTEEERGEIIALEKKAGKILEAIYRITPQSDSFYPEYFLTPEGRTDFESIVGEALPKNSTPEDIKKILFTSELLKKADTKKRANLAGRSRDYDEEKRFVALSQTLDENGRIDITQASAPERINIIFTPEKKRKKLSLLRAFKSNLKHYTDNHPGVLAEKSPDFQKAFSGIVNLYISRTNDLIIDQNGSLFTLAEKRVLLGEEALTSDEQKLLEKTFGLENPEGTLARYDKFTFGASEEYDSLSGERDQISQELTQFADEFEAIYTKSILEKDALIRAKGLDPEKISTPNISPEQVIELAEEVLGSYGFLSDQPTSEYSKDRSEPAPDNKWQFVAREEFKTHAINIKRKIIKSSLKPQSIDKLISVTLAHEIEGHVVQAENQARVPLQLFQTLGGGRSVVFSECGAMNNQDFVSGEAFGFASPPHPHYIRAMERKLAGGDYLDCVEAFYNSALKETKLKRDLDKLTPEAFIKECETNLKLAINRTKRLFASGSSFTSEAGLLTHSKDTVYLEQVKLYQELKKHGLEKYVYVRGANLKTLLFLMEAGFLNPDDIQKPAFHSLKIWERIKDKYTQEA